MIFRGRFLIINALGNFIVENPDDSSLIGSLVYDIHRQEVIKDTVRQQLEYVSWAELNARMEHHNTLHKLAAEKQLLDLASTSFIVHEAELALLQEAYGSDVPKEPEEKPIKRSEGDWKY